jgi:hypothetical protein
MSLVLAIIRALSLGIIVIRSQAEREIEATVMDGGRAI